MTGSATRVTAVSPVKLHTRESPSSTFTLFSNELAPESMFLRTSWTDNRVWAGVHAHFFHCFRCSAMSLLQNLSAVVFLRKGVGKDVKTSFSCIWQEDNFCFFDLCWSCGRNSTDIVGCWKNSNLVHTQWTTGKFWYNYPHGKLLLENVCFFVSFSQISCREDQFPVSHHTQCGLSFAAVVHMNWAHVWINSSVRIWRIAEHHNVMWQFSSTVSSLIRILQEMRHVLEKLCFFCCFRAMTQQNVSQRIRLLGLSGLNQKLKLQTSKWTLEVATFVCARLLGFEWQFGNQKCWNTATQTSLTNNNNANVPSSSEDNCRSITEQLPVK